jgi:hypothetical protein
MKQETLEEPCVQCCGTGEIQKSTNRKQSNFECDICSGRGYWNKVIEPKQEETLEEAAERKFQNIGDRLIFEDGAKWQKEQYTIEEQCVGHTIDELDKEYIKGFNEGSAYQQERSYSEEEVLDILKELEIECVINPRRTEIREWFEQFKKK